MFSNAAFIKENNMDTDMKTKVQMDIYVMIHV
jgi:hypothetical protein